MADHYARTFTAAGATTLTLDGMPFGAGRLIGDRDALGDEFQDLPPAVLEVLQSALDYGYDFVWLQF